MLLIVVRRLLISICFFERKIFVLAQAWAMKTAKRTALKINLYVRVYLSLYITVLENII